MVGGADLQSCRDAGQPRCLHLNRLEELALKAGCRDLELVGSELEVGEGVAATGLRGGATDVVGSQVAEFQNGGGDGGPRWIDNGDADGADVTGLGPGGGNDGSYQGEESEEGEGEARAHRRT